MQFQWRTLQKPALLLWMEELYHSFSRSDCIAVSQISPPSRRPHSCRSFSPSHRWCVILYHPLSRSPFPPPMINALIFFQRIKFVSMALLLLPGGCYTSEGQVVGRNGCTLSATLHRKRLRCLTALTIHGGHYSHLWHAQTHSDVLCGGTGKLTEKTGSLIVG